MPLAVTYALEIIGAIPKVIAAGIDIMGYFKDAEDTLKRAQEEGRDITDDEFEILNQTIEVLRAQRPDVSKE